MVSETPTSDYDHMQQKVNFRIKEVPTPSVVAWLFKSEYIDMQVGALFEHIAMQLFQTPLAMTSKVDFTLVNVLATDLHQSAGFLPMPPPPDGMPDTSPRLVFTFAIRQDLDYFGKPVQRQFKSTWVNTFNVVAFRRPQFINVSVPVTLAGQWGLTGMTWTRVQYLYYIIGAMTKAFVRRNRYYTMGDEPYQYGSDLRRTMRYWGLISGLPFSRLASAVPYNYWAFNRQVLSGQANILSSRHITPEMVLYMVLSGSLGDYSYFTTENQQRFVDIVSESITLFVQNAATTGDVQVTAIDMIVPAMLFVELDPMVTHVTSFGSAYDRLYDLTVLWSELLEPHTEQLSSILMPPRATAERLMDGNARAMYRLVDLVRTAATPQAVQTAPQPSTGEPT